MFKPLDTRNCSQLRWQINNLLDGVSHRLLIGLSEVLLKWPKPVNYRFKALPASGYLVWESPGL
jgi:hypothetical protein